MFDREGLEVKGEDSEGDRVPDVLKVSKGVVRTPVEVARLCGVAQGMSEKENED